MKYCGRMSCNKLKETGNECYIIYSHPFNSLNWFGRVHYSAVKCHLGRPQVRQSDIRLYFSKIYENAHVKNRQFCTVPTLSE